MCFFTSSAFNNVYFNHSAQYSQILQKIFSISPYNQVPNTAPIGLATDETYSRPINEIFTLIDSPSVLTISNLISLGPI